MGKEASAASAVVTFRKALLSSVGPLRADTSALGTLPTAAFQYCEAVRTASSFGWYIFPPCDIRLLWDGTQILVAKDGDWCVLDNIPYDFVRSVDPGFVEYWNECAPEELKDRWPPLITGLFHPGIIQIWSGLLVTTAEDWGISVGAAANLRHSSDYFPFEAIVEANDCRPLFINIQLVATGREICIQRHKPLFQVKPIHESCFSEKTMRCAEHEGITPATETEIGMSEADWRGYRNSVNLLFEREDFSAGRYAVSRRKERKNRDREVCPVHSALLQP